MCCGTPGVNRSTCIYVHVLLPSEAALQEYQLINACPPKDAGKFALKLLSIFYSPEVLSRLNCTKAEGETFWIPINYWTANVSANKVIVQLHNTCDNIINFGHAFSLQSKQISYLQLKKAIKKQDGIL